MKELTKKQKAKSIVIDDVKWLKEGGQKVISLIQNSLKISEYCVAIGQNSRENYLYDSTGIYYTTQRTGAGENWELQLKEEFYYAHMLMRTIVEKMLCDMGEPVSKVFLFPQENKKTMLIIGGNAKYEEFYDPPPIEAFSETKKLNFAPAI
jgi:hypothetical protein